MFQVFGRATLRFPSRALHELAFGGASRRDALNVRDAKSARVHDQSVRLIPGTRSLVDSYIMGHIISSYTKYAVEHGPEIPSSM